MQELSFRQFSSVPQERKSSPLTPVINQLMRKDKELSDLRDEIKNQNNRFNLKIQVLESELKEKNQKIQNLEQQKNIYVELNQQEQQSQIDNLNSKLSELEQKYKNRKLQMKRLYKENQQYFKEITNMKMESNKYQMITEEYFEVLKKYGKSQQIIQQLKQQLLLNQDETFRMSRNDSRSFLKRPFRPPEIGSLNRSNQRSFNDLKENFNEQNFIS